jgi:cyclophilin family peptidyl-prolyl cis-trans isomerase
MSRIVEEGREPLARARVGRTLALAAAWLIALSGLACTPGSQAQPTTQAAKPAATAAPAAGQAAKTAASPAAAQAAPNKPGGAAPAVSSKQWQSPPAMQIDQNKRYSATIGTTLGTMTAELYAKEAPNTVNNFVFLAREGFYNGVPFHRIIRDFMIQTGDPTGTGTGGPGYRFADELNTPHKYEKGTLAMANAGPNTQGSQFFIVHGQQGTTLPKNYTIFGKVTDGLDTLDKLASVPVERSPQGENSKPKEVPRIESVTINEG